MSKSEFDVIVLGAGPAGAIAATALAQKKRRVLLLERAKFPRKVPCGGWLTGLAEPFLAELGLNTKKILAKPFRDVTFHSPDFEKSSAPKLDRDFGFIIDRAAFDSALVDLAKKAGAVFKSEHEVSDVKLNESGVEVVQRGGTSNSARLLVLATGRSAAWLDTVGVSRGRGDATILNAQVEAAMPKKSAPKQPHVSVVLGLDGGASFGLIGLTKDRIVINVNWRGEPDAVVRNLIQLCRSAHAAGIVPMDLSDLAVSAPVIKSPAALALDMDTHVGKHALVVGDAGGFVSAASNEGIYPAMWSAKIAAEVIHNSLDSTYVQDELMQFNSMWRMAMADHLRSPHTDVRFLLPLIFSNQPMADRMGAAFFFGENI